MPVKAAPAVSSVSPRTLATLPALVLMFVGQRFIIAGLTLGSVK